MTTPQERRQALKDSLAERVLVLDGAMGTMIHAAPLSIETDYLGRENCPEILNVTRPDVIQDIHRQYLEAGADIIETNTFGGTRIALADNKLEDRAYELNFAAARLAREIADQFSTAAQPRFVAGSIGPTNKDLNITGTTTFAELRADYYLQAKGLVEGGADHVQQRRRARTALAVSRSQSPSASDHASVQPVVQGGRQSRGAAQDGPAAFASPQLRDPPARARQGHSPDPGVARTFQA